MPKKYICPFSTEELKKLYLDDGRTLKEMCDVLGIKNTITASKVLREHGISTNANARKAENTKHNMNDTEFRRYLEEKYQSGMSMMDIANLLGITPSGVRKYFIKYGIPRVSRTHRFETDASKNPNWRGGRRICSNGYISIYCPDHPNASVRKTMYEHQLVMEAHIGRYLEKGEVVHHIDGDKSNNDISNLLLLSSSDHAKLHAILKRSAERMKAAAKGDD